MMIRPGSGGDILAVQVMPRVHVLFDPREGASVLCVLQDTQYKVIAMPRFVIEGQEQSSRTFEETWAVAP